MLPDGAGVASEINRNCSQMGHSAMLWRREKLWFMIAHALVAQFLDRGVNGPLP